VGREKQKPTIGELGGFLPHWGQDETKLGLRRLKMEEIFQRPEGIGGKLGDQKEITDSGIGEGEGQCNKREVSAFEGGRSSKSHEEGDLGRSRTAGAKRRKEEKRKVFFPGR